MQIQRTNVSNTEIKLIITADADELGPIKDGVVARLGANVKVAGFRSGKAPLHLIEKNIDQNMLQGDFLDEAMTQLYAKATVDEKIRPVTRPQVTLKKFVPFTELEYEVIAGIIGEIKLPDYKKIKIPAETVSVSAKDVTEVIDSLKTRLAEKKEVSRAAKMGDEVVIDFKGVDSKGTAIDGAEGHDYPLKLGSKAFIPGFEEEVVGLKPGEEKSFDITFPKDYSVADLAGSHVTFTITAKTVNELVEPKADDEFAAKIGPFKTLAELKADIKKQLTEEKEREAETKRQNEILKAVSDKSKVEMPAALIDQQVSYNLEEVRRNATYQGRTYKELLEAEGKTEEDYKQELRPQAEEQLKASLVLAEIADLEKLTIEKDELDIRIMQLKQQYTDQAMQAELDKPENRQDIASRMLSEKVVNFLLSFSK